MGRECLDANAIHSTLCMIRFLLPIGNNVSGIQICTKGIRTASFRTRVSCERVYDQHLSPLDSIEQQRHPTRDHYNERIDIEMGSNK